MNPETSGSAADRWEHLYNQTPLGETPRHFAGMGGSPFLREYLTTVLRLAPRGTRTLETGIGSGYGAVWLSLRGVRAEGIDYSPKIVERARHVNHRLGGSAAFRVGDLFDLYESEHETAPYQVIHHQGVLEHFTLPQVRAALAQQVARASWVVFSVPSVYYPFDPEFGDERLLTLEAWQHLLAPFDVAELRYYGDPTLGGQEHILGVLRGHAGDPPGDALRALMTVPAEPYPEGISAIVHTRNEARHIADCLQTLQGWTDEVLVCDMESEDATPEIARSLGAQVLSHPRIANFDRARNVSALHARYRWVFFLDADERVPPALGPALRALTQAQGDRFEGLLLPFHHHFAGQPLQCLYPGYTAPRLLKNGRFFWSARPHTGAQVEGRIVSFPADNPDLALVHYSFEDLHHYLDKLNAYTDSESANMHRDGQPFHWQNAIRHFVQDFQAYYDQSQAGAKDGVHGFLYAFLSAFYRFEQHAKLYEHRFRHGQLQPAETGLPGSVEQVLEFALRVVREKPLPQTRALRVRADAPDAAEIVWSGPLYDPSGYGEESRHFLFALDDAAGLPVAAQPLPWSHDVVDLTPDERRRLDALAQRPARPGFVHIHQDFPTRFTRHPEAGVTIGRTMFETDRLPPDWVQGCNRLDYVWVPSAFNQTTFAQAGVDAAKLVVMPGCLDPVLFAQPGEPSALSEVLRDSGRFLFLSVFDWTRHKGWDVLLRAFLEAFPNREDVLLVLKVWSTLGYTNAQITEQAGAYVRQTLGHDLTSDRRIRFVFDRLTRAQLTGLYRAANAFVLPSRGEGWGRPYLEAMACGLPTIGTNWSGNTAFMTHENSYLLDYALEAVPEEGGWREIPTYRGHRWAEPDGEGLVQFLRRVTEERSEAAQVGGRAREQVLTRFSRSVVGRQMAQEIARVREVLRSHPVLIAAPPEVGTTLEAEDPAARLSPSRGPIPVLWEGAQFRWHSLAHVNREFCLGLLASGQLDLSLVPIEPVEFGPSDVPRFGPLAARLFAPLSAPAIVEVRHAFPPRLDRPEQGHLVLMQPWEYGSLPAAWVEPIQQNVSEVWCYSHFVREVYVRSGVAAEKLHIVPLGVDTGVFTPEAPSYVFTTEPGAPALRPAPSGQPERFVFLFVGGTLHRKGIDILLAAYLKAFSAYDDVCLVIKDTATRTVYQGQNEQERILALTQDPTRPALVYLEEDLSSHRLAGVYTAAHCLVQPYRGEGFCLPALEALACGVPVIVPTGGPTDDFVDEAVGWRVPAEQRPFGEGRIGPWECVGRTTLLEVAEDDLARLLRHVYANREEAARRGRAGMERVRGGWTWQHASTKALERLQALRERPEPPPALPPSARREEASGPRDQEGEQPAAQRARPTISLCLIVKNEERVLRDCLDSVSPWVDEMIVVDTGSTDRTVEIATAAGAKVFFFPWCDDFSAARNESLAHATGDWLFWMDADDTLPAACGSRLRDLAFLAEDRVTGFLLQVHIPPAPGETGFTIVDHVKLFRNLPDLRFEGRIHEQILEAIYRHGGQVERSDLYVVHSGYDYSPEGQQQKRVRDLTLLEKDLAERPNHPFVWFNIGMTAYHLKDYARAVPALERCLTLAKPQESIVRKVYAMLAGSHLEQGDTTGARDWIEKGLAQFPHDPELLFRAGIVYREAGDLIAAERSYRTLLTEREVGHIDSLDVTMTGYKAHHNLALIYQDMGRLAEAEAAWRAAVTDNPAFVPSWLGLGELFLSQGRSADVQAVVGRLSEISLADAEVLRQRLFDATGT